MKKVLLLTGFIVFSWLGGYAQNFNSMKKIGPPNTDSARVAGDLFGYSVAISGNYAVVGAHSQDYDSAGGNYKSNAGAVYVFERRAGVWGYAKKLTPPNTDSARVAGDGFGRSVAISGDYIIVAASLNNGSIGQDWDSAGGNYKSNAGAVYIFERQNGNWGYVKKLTPPNTDSARVASDFFGFSTAISGNYAIVGAPNQDYDSVGGSNRSSAGAAYIFERRNGVWGYAKKLSVPTNRVAVDLFGYSVAMSGGYAIVGAIQQDTDSAGVNSKSEVGAAYMYELNNGSWNFVKKITPPNADSARMSQDLFGYKVAIDGTTAVVGSHQQDYDSIGTTFKSAAGAAYVFERNNGEWGYIKKLTADNNTGNRTANDQFGISLGISGNNIAIGAYQNTYDSTLSNSLTNAGTVYIFEKRNGVWGYAKKLSTTGTNARNASDVFGSSVAISGNYLIGGCASITNIGQSYDSAGGNFKSNAGAAYIFENMLSLEYNNGWVGASPSSTTDNYNCYVRGGTATISADAKINSLEVDNGTTATLSGNLNIINNYTNNGTVSGGTVLLIGGSTHEILGNGTTQNLKLNNTIDGGGADVRDSLSINGVLTLTKGTIHTNGKLKLEATGATTYGQIAGTGTGTLSGNLTAEMLIAGGGADWRPVNSPVSGATLAQVNDDVNLNFGTPDNGFATVYYFNEQTSPYWSIPTGTSEAFGDSAYSIYMGGTSSWANPLPLTLDIQGTYRGTSDSTHANLTRTGSRADTTGWHYIGNPWPSGFTWDDNNITINSGGVQGNQVWLYNQSAGAYQVFDGTDNGVIPPFTPMLIEVTSNNTSITLKNSARTTDSLVNYFDKTSLPNFIQIEVADDKGRTDKVKWYTDENATNGYDAMDGNKRPNLVAPNLYFVLEGKKSNKEVWNTLPEENEPVQLNFEAKQAGKHTFSFNTENLEPETTVELLDKLSGTKHNITKGDYTFAHDLNNTSDRFELKFSKKATTTGIEEVQAETMYVGSTDNTITINAPNTANYTVEVLDLLGRTVQAPVSFTGNQIQTVTVNGVSTGYYLVKVNGDNVFKTAKVFLK